MIIDISTTIKGNYLVSAYYEKDGYGQWHPLRTFETQGDALRFRNDCYKAYSQMELEAFAKTFTATKTYKWIDNKRITTL